MLVAKRIMAQWSDRLDFRRIYTIHYCKWSGDSILDRAGYSHNWLLDDTD